MLDWTWLDTWIVIVGALGAMACALVGNFLVLRKLSMMGDAISHAVLPGLALAFLMTNSRASLPMFIGAAIVGVLTALFTEWVRRFGKVDESASMGVVFTTLFAAGLILIVQAADAVDLDPGCVLYGAIELTPLDTVSILSGSVPRAAAILAIVLGLDVLFVLVFYKELKITAFDPALASAMGINAGLMHYLLMVFVAMTVVACFESVGSILVIAMLIVPAATAHLLTDRLAVMLVLSMAVGAASAALGHVGALVVPGFFGYADTTTAGMIAVAAGALFAVAAVAAPRHGIVSKMVHQRLLGLDVVRADILGLLYRIDELTAQTGPQPVPVANRAFIGEAIPGSSWARGLVLRRLVARGKVTRVGEIYTITDDGREEARHVIRSHRLWETFLWEYLNKRLDQLHRPAEQLEHITDARLRAQLDDTTGHPTHDPHGSPIPPPPESGI